MKPCEDTCCSRTAGCSTRWWTRCSRTWPACSSSSASSWPCGWMSKKSWPAAPVPSLAPNGPREGPREGTGL